MKSKFFLFCLVFLTQAYLLSAQSMYNDYLASEKQQIFKDDFHLKKDEWKMKNNDFSSAKFNEMLMNLKSVLLLKNNSAEAKDLLIDIEIDQAKDYEIETTFDFRSESGMLGFLWGVGSKGRYMLNINANKTWEVVCAGDKGKEDINKKSNVELINLSNPNTLTIRKSDKTWYFFINDRFVTKTNVRTFFGKGIGYSFSCDCSVYSLTVSYLNTKKFKGEGKIQEVVVNTDNTFTDLRDGNKYKIVKISEQTLMTENLRYKPRNEPHFSGYTNKSEDIEKHGYFYDWETAKSVCPMSWHLPSRDEFNVLCQTLSQGPGNPRKYFSLLQNNTGFASKFYGIVWNDGNYKDEGTSSNYWSSTKSEEKGPYFLGVYMEDRTGGVFAYDNDRYGMSVRCFLDNSKENVIENKPIYENKPVEEKKSVIENKISANSMTDGRDGHVYNTIKIGSQVWMAQNLSFKPASGEYYAYKNDIQNVDNYGYLYVYETAKNVCPSGWHLPQKSEFESLLKTSGGEGKNAYSQLMANGNSGFNPEYGGIRNVYGVFEVKDIQANYWSSTEENENNAWHLFISKQGNEASMSSWLKGVAFPVRCVKD